MKRMTSGGAASRYGRNTNDLMLKDFSAIIAPGEDVSVSASLFAEANAGIAHAHGHHYGARDQGRNDEDIYLHPTFHSPEIDLQATVVVEKRLRKNASITARDHIVISTSDERDGGLERERERGNGTPRGMQTSFSLRAPETKHLSPPWEARRKNSLPLPAIGSRPVTTAQPGVRESRDSGGVPFRPQTAAPRPMTSCRSEVISAVIPGMQRVPSALGPKLPPLALPSRPTTGAVFDLPADTSRHSTARSSRPGTAAIPGMKPVDLDDLPGTSRTMQGALSEFSGASSVDGGLGQIEIDDEDDIPDSLVFAVNAWKILKDYLSTVVVCVSASVIGLMIMVVLARMAWETPDAAGYVQFNRLNYTLLGCMVGLMSIASFVGVEFVATFGMHQFFSTRFYLVVVIAAVFQCAMLLVLWYFDFQLHFYYVDVFIIVGTYVCMAFCLGYYGSQRPDMRGRVRSGGWFLLMEVIISATAVGYGLLLMPIFGSLSPLNKAIWRTTLHPTFFELLCMIPVRYLVSKELKHNSITSSLAVVHAQAHITSMGRFMLTNIGDLGITTLTVFLVNFGKLLFRSTASIRDSMMHWFRPKRIEPIEGQHAQEQEVNKFVRAVSLHADIIMDNSSILVASFTIFLFKPHENWFMLPFPPGDQKEVFVFAVCSVLIQFGIGWLFDFAALYMGARYSKLPITFTWEKMKKHSGAFFGFLIFGGISMGHIATLYMMAKVPRVLFCPSDDNCSCNFVLQVCNIVYEPPDMP